MVSFCNDYVGYHRVVIKEEDMLKTTFTTPYNTFAYKKMTFYLCNARRIFQWIQTKIFALLVGKLLRVYLNNF